MGLAVERTEEPVVVETESAEAVGVRRAVAGAVEVVGASVE